MFTALLLARPSAQNRRLTAALAATLTLSLAGFAQQQSPIPATPSTSDSAPASVQAQTPTSAAPAASPTAPSAAAKVPITESQEPGAITEEEIKHLLVGKSLYLRGGYLDNSLSFNEHGGLIGHSPQGSYTLNAIQIERIHLTKHKLELEGARYGLHFVGQLAYEDASTAFDRVRITPKKKLVKITIDRESVIKPKKEKDLKKEKDNKKNPKAKSASAAGPSAADATKELTPTEQAQAEIAAAPAAERPADPKSITTTTSPAHAAQLLRSALDTIFAPGLDERMMESLPDFWKLYYQAAAAGVDYRPKDPTVLRQSAVDRKARLITNFEPPSNEFAQANTVAGPALYHAVIGPDGKPGEIAVARPIGFGLDENAVQSIRNAKFEPAFKDGKPVSVLLDLFVQFRIYSARTAVASPLDPAEKDKATESKPATPQLPGPYSVPR
jgi:outer membrane biosynthesis protein TonB